MRSTIATIFLGLSLVAGCEVGSTGGGGGGGDDTGGGGVDAAVSQTPKLDVMVDKSAISTELGSTSMITVSLTASGGFSGAVALSATVVDATDVPLSGWTVVFNSPSVNLAANGTGSAVATLTIPTLNAGLAGSVKLKAMSSLGAQNFVSTVTVLNQVTMSVTQNAAQQCVYPTTGTMMVKAGTKVRFMNKFTQDAITIHSNGGGQGVAHEPDPGHAINTVYERTFAGTGTFDWYCHAPGPNLDRRQQGGTNDNPKFTVVP